MVQPQSQIEILAAPGSKGVVEAARTPEIIGAHRAVAAPEQVPRAQATAEVEPAERETLVPEIEEGGVVAEPCDDLFRAQCLQQVFQTPQLPSRWLVSVAVAD